MSLHTTEQQTKSLFDVFNNDSENSLNTINSNDDDDDDDNRLLIGKSYSFLYYLSLL